MTTSANTAAPISIYHNPDCGTSRTVLALIRAAGIEPQVIEYLKCPPSAALLAQLAQRAGVGAHALLRQRNQPWLALGLDPAAMDDAALLAAMARHPQLLERPLVAGPLGVALCRPAERVLQLLPTSAPD